MDRVSRYPGLHGYVDVSGVQPLSEQKRRGLRASLESFSADVADPDAFFEDVLHHVHLLRSLQIKDRERLVGARRDVIAAALKAARRGEAMPVFSAILSRDAEILRRLHPGADERQILKLLRSKLPSVGSGRAPDDALHFVAAMLAGVLEHHSNKPATTKTGGDFVELLEIVATAADGKHRQNLHSVAEAALKMRPQPYGDGVMFISRNLDEGEN